jgi:anhydro-N-acetylmuramic acid kinase
MALIGGSENRLLVAAILDPGLRVVAFDGTTNWIPLILPGLIAEETGVSVIDALPERDLACGGRGSPLEPLAWWIIFGDRSSPVAFTARVVLQDAPFCAMTWLPPSDGLDEELPLIQRAVFPGRRLLDELVRVAPEELRSMARPNGELFELLDQLTRAGFDPVAAYERDDVASSAADLVRGNRIARADVDATFRQFAASQLGEFLIRCKTPAARRIELVWGGDHAMSESLFAGIGEESDAVSWNGAEAVQYDPRSLGSASASVLGLMHIDQMPATLPWLTGARQPRILGRLTPGNPANFRRLVMEMGDSRPPVMKLRDAV